MNRFHLLLCCLLVLAAVLTHAFLQSEARVATSVGHPQFSAMRQGGLPERGGSFLFVGWCYGVAQLIFFAVNISLGLKQQAPPARRAASRWLTAATLLYLGTFTMIVVTSSSAEAASRASVFFGLPPAAAWSIFGMWFAPLIYVGLYLWKFPSWIFDEEDAQRFAELKSRFQQDARHE